MYNRYNKTQKIINATSLYKSFFDNKNIKNPMHYSTFDFKMLRDIDKQNLDSIIHFVEPYEKLYNISQKYYNSPEYGWLICYTNKIANELLITVGQPLTIYVPVDEVIGFLTNGS